MNSEKPPASDRKYAIMADSLKKPGQALALARAAARDHLSGWWTDNDPDSIWLMSRAKADDMLSRLQYNNPRVVREDKAIARITKQAAALQDTGADDAGDFIWVTRLGEMIPFDRMGDIHLLNTLKFIRKRLADLQTQHDQMAMDQNILGDNPEGFTGIEPRIEYMQTAERLAVAEIDARGIAGPAPLEAREKEPI
jgi:hypothetical protein